MIKKIIFMGLLACNLFALGGIDSLPEDEQNVAKKIQKVLDLKQDDAFKLYKEYFQVYLNAKHWQIHFFDNSDPAKGKMGISNQKTMFLSLINDNRLVNISIVKFPRLNQLLIYSVETVPGKSSSVLGKFDRLKESDKFKKERETSKFAYFSEKGYMSKVNIFVSPPVGVVQYVDLYVFNLN